MALDQLLVEGFLAKPLQKLAADEGRTIDKQWQSLRLLQETDEAGAVMEPLARLHRLRSILKGHGAPSERTAESKDARKEYGTFRAHFTALAGECDAALVALLKAFRI